MTRTSIIPLVEGDSDDGELALRAFEKSEVANKIVVANPGEEALDYLLATGTHAGRDPTVMPEVVLLDLDPAMVDWLEVLRRVRLDPRKGQDNG